jgi:hypothetical protein
MRYIYSIDERVAHYSGNPYNHIFHRSDLPKMFDYHKWAVCMGDDIDNSDIEDTTEMSDYHKNLVGCYHRIYNTINSVKKEYPHLKDKKALAHVSDNTASWEIPIICKTRPIDNIGGNTIAPIRMTRNYGHVLELPRIDCKVSEKIPGVMWRGLLHLKKNYRLNNRLSLIEKFYNHPNDLINIKHTGIPCNEFVASEEVLGYKFGDYLSVGEMLKYRFNVSIEGWDMASNLQWILASNSIAMAPKMVIESWFMESKLEPWVHYIPIEDDCSDLIEVYEWALMHPNACDVINRNAKMFMNEFVDKKREREIFFRVVKKYLENCNFV